MFEVVTKSMEIKVFNSIQFYSIVTMLSYCYYETTENSMKYYKELKFPTKLIVMKVLIWTKNKCNPVSVFVLLWFASHVSIFRHDDKDRI